jgi:NADH:ubiquinone reductase (H+-translocating)
MAASLSIQTTEVPGWPQVWAIGDCAEIKQADGKISPATADHAMRQAKACAQNIVASCRGASKKHFRFTGLGRLGSLGRRSAVAEILGFRFKGIFAWLLWRGAYVAKFPGLDGQLRVITDWLLDAFLPCDITQLRIFHEEAGGPPRAFRGRRDSLRQWGFWRQGLFYCPG